LSFDLRHLKRRLKPEKRIATLTRRSDAELPFADPALIPRGSGLLLDACVYIDAVAGRLPAPAAELFAGRLVQHASVALTELTFTLGALDPRDRRSREHARIVGNIVEKIAASPRFLVPDDEIWAMGGMLAGILARTQGYGREARRRALLDCLLFLLAGKSGLILLTANLAEFDLLSQIMPEIRLAFYRPG
jgi:predicted nucleic acid-binding protein